MADHRLTHRADGRQHGWQQTRVFDTDLVVLGAEGLGHQVRILEFVPAHAARRLEADAERAQAALPGIRQKSDYQARIKAAREQYASRHVGHHAPTHGLFQQASQLFYPDFGLQRHLRAREARAPVDLIALAAVGLDDAQRRGG